MDDRLRHETLVEFIGTFVLVFIGGLTVVVAPLHGLLVPVFGHGLIVIGLIYAYGHISGAHINPAVTLGLLVGGEVNTTKTMAYMIAQFMGGIVAALVIVLLLPDGAQAALLGEVEFNYGQTKGALTDNYVIGAVVLEFILTFLLVSAIYQSAVYGKAGNLAAVAIGFTLAACILAGGPLCGASLNPARTLGPAIMAGEFDYVLPYFVGIFGGGAAAGAMHTYVLAPVNQ